VEDEVGQVLGGKDEIGAERDELTGDRNVQPVQADAGREPALLIIFAIIGQEALGTTPRMRPRETTSAQL
jgi:hypothetical protein